MFVYPMSMPVKPLQFDTHYHIFNRGNNRENLFVEPRNYPYFLKLYRKHILPVADTFAYCLLPNHFHLLIRTRSEEEQQVYVDANGDDTNASTPFKPKHPSYAFRNFFIAYARAFNKATGRSGTLFERPFHRKIVDNEPYLLNALIYIHRNPQNHGIIDDYREWPWSSYGAYCSDQPSNIERASFIEKFGTKGALIERHRDFTGAKLVEAYLFDM